PLERLLNLIPQHRILVEKFLSGNKHLQEPLTQKEVEVAKAFEALEGVDATLGTALQFTDEGLAKRKREHVRVANVKKEWEELKAGYIQLTPEASAERHLHLISDVRTMITHSGDTSNLILDPDLDSYYLMDVTLIALPQAQDRIAAVMSAAEPLIKKKAFTNKDRVQLSIHAAMLKEADLDHVNASAQTSLNEDVNFYGSS